MSTLGELRAALRVVLGDNSAAGYLWSDAQMNRLLADAVKGYGRLFPREVATSVLVVVGQAAYALPAGCVRVVRVELVAAGDTEGEVLVEGGDSYGWGYRCFGSELVLTVTPTAALGTLQVDYVGEHAALAADGDVCSVPDGDEDLVLTLAGAKACESLGLEEAKRRRFEERAGQAASSAGEAFRREWETGVAERGRVVRGSRLVIR